MVGHKSRGFLLLKWCRMGCRYRFLSWDDYPCFLCRVDKVLFERE